MGSLPQLVQILQLLALLGNVQHGIGTVFSAHGDPQNPNPHLACTHYDMDDDKDVVVAHRTLRCGARVAVCLPRTGKCVFAVVADRGPYGKRPDGSYTAIVDMSPRLAKMLGHNGYEQVVVVEDGGALGELPKGRVRTRVDRKPRI